MFCNTADEILFANVRASVARALPLLRQVPAHDRIAVLVGGGPSLADTLDDIRAHAAAGADIFVLNGAGKWLAEHGITPHGVVVLDARESNHRFVDVPGDDITFYLASQCDASLFAKTAGRRVVMWHANYDGKSGVVESRPTVLVGGGTVVGLHAMMLAHILGYRTLHLYGYDSSYRGDANHAYPQAENDADRPIECEAAGKSFMASPWMIRQADDFQDVALALADEGSDIHVHGEGLLPTVARAMVRHKLPPVTRGELTAFYDLTVAPASYDIVTFLAFAEQERIARGLGRMKVVIAPGPAHGFRFDLIPPLEPEHRRQMLWGIVLPMCRLVPSVGSVVLAQSREEAAIHERGDIYPRRYSVECPSPGYGHVPLIRMLRDRDISLYRAPDWATGHVRAWMKRDTIVITLRETHYGMHRNSSVAEWLDAASELRGRGYDILFIRDTGEAYGAHFHGWPVCHAASFDLAYRLAVYECAALNLFISNAFTMALLAPGVRAMVFGLIRDEKEFLSADDWAARGLPKGAQYGHVGHRFRVVWSDESAERIVDAALGFLDELARAKHPIATLAGE